MIYLIFQKSEGDLHEAGIAARNKLFSLFSIDEGDVAVGDLGKPYLKSGKAGFSISHSGDIALCALRTDTEMYGAPDEVTVIFENALGGDIGCDIEEIDPLISEKKMKRISKRFLGREVSDAAEFYRLWTRAEAYGKYTGKGLLDGKSIPENAVFYSFEIDIEGQKYSVGICT